MNIHKYLSDKPFFRYSTYGMQEVLYDLVVLSLESFIVNHQRSYFLEVWMLLWKGEVNTWWQGKCINEMPVTKYPVYILSPQCSRIQEREASCCLVMPPDPRFEPCLMVGIMGEARHPVTWGKGLESPPHPSSTPLKASPWAHGPPTPPSFSPGRDDSVGQL